LLLIYNGQIIHQHLDQSGLSMEELESAVREHGVEKIKQVNLAILEVDGNISVLSDNVSSKSTNKRRGHKIVRKNG